MIEYFGHGFLPKKLLLWCLVMIIISEFQLWCTPKADSCWSWSGLRTSFAVLSAQEISIFTFSHPLDIKWGTLLYPKTAVAPQWAPESFPGWVQSSHWSVACVVFCFFPLCPKSVNSPCPHRRCRGLSLLFIWGLCCLNVLASRASPNSVMLSLNCLPCFNSFSRADLQLSNSYNNLEQTAAGGSSLQCSVQLC